MAGFDPQSFGFKSRADVGTFLLIGGITGALEAFFNRAASDPIILGAMVGAAAVGAKKLIFDRSQDEEDRNSPLPTV